MSAAAPQTDTSESHVKSLSKLFSRSVMNTPESFAASQKKQTVHQQHQVTEAKSQARGFRASLRSAIAIIAPRRLRKSNSNSNSLVSPSASLIAQNERLSQPGFSGKAATNPLFSKSNAINEETTAPTLDKEDAPDAPMSRPMRQAHGDIEDVATAPMPRPIRQAHGDSEDVADAPVSRPLRQMSADQWVIRNDVEDVNDTIIHAPISFEIAGVGKEVNNYINARHTSAVMKCTPPQSSEEIDGGKAEMRVAMGKGEYSRVLELAQTIGGELARLGSTTEALEYYFIALSYSTREGLPKCYRDIFETMGDPAVVGSGRVNSGQRSQFLTLSEAVST